MGIGKKIDVDVVDERVRERLMIMPMDERAGGPMVTERVKDKKYMDF